MNINEQFGTQGHFLKEKYPPGQTTWHGTVGPERESANGENCPPRHRGVSQRLAMAELASNRNAR
jgi:hypothetical protein